MNGRPFWVIIRARRAPVHRVESNSCLTVLNWAVLPTLDAHLEKINDICSFFSNLLTPKNLAVKFLRLGVRLPKAALKGLNLLVSLISFLGWSRKSTLKSWESACPTTTRPLRISATSAWTSVNSGASTRSEGRIPETAVLEANYVFIETLSKKTSYL